jgi:phosphatidylinositol-3-phosphatase
MWAHSRLCFSLIAAAILTFMLTGCSGGASVGSGGSGSIPQVQHVAVVVLENANFTDVVGSASMPFLNSLLAKGALAGQYFANTHPSLPNYFTMTTGDAVTNDDSFDGTVDTDNDVRELTASARSWKVYAESIPSPGYLGGDQGSYLRRHNPFSFFSDVQQSTSQAANIVPFTQFSADRSGGNLPNYAFIVPNAQDDAHSCPDGSTTNCTLESRLQRADQWMQSNIAPLLSDSSFQQSGLLIITFDESADDSTNGGGHIATVLVGSRVKTGYTGNTTSYDHRSLLSLTMKALGVSNIPNGADSAPQMGEFFQ